MKMEYGLTVDSDQSIIYRTAYATYSLLEGVTNNGLNSDILFIYREPIFVGNDVILGEVVNFIYGGFSRENLKEVKNIIEKYEKEKLI